MNSWQKDIWHFHRASGTPAPDQVSYPSAEDIERRKKLIAEEAKETCDALQKLKEIRDRVNQTTEAKDYRENIDLQLKAQDALREVVDGLVDTVVVVLGTAVEMGVDLDPAWAEVHLTNMAKYPYHKNEWGKVLKPEGWTPPDIPLVPQSGKTLGKALGL